MSAVRFRPSPQTLKTAKSGLFLLCPSRRPSWSPAHALPSIKCWKTDGKRPWSPLRLQTLYQCSGREGGHECALPCNRLRSVPSPDVPPFLTGFPGDRSTGPYFAGFRKWFVFSSQAFQYQDVPAPGHRIVLVVHQTAQTYGGFHTSFCACHWEENSCNTRYLRLQIQMVCAC